MGRVSPEVKEVTVQAIKQMVGRNRSWNGPVRDLVDLVIVNSSSFESDTADQARERLGGIVREWAEKINEGRAPSIEVCTDPEFWKSELGVQVHEELKEYFDGIRSKKSA